MQQRTGVKYNFPKWEIPIRGGLTMGRRRRRNYEKTVRVSRGLFGDKIIKTTWAPAGSGFLSTLIVIGLGIVVLRGCACRSANAEASMGLPPMQISQND